jgi:hypothetical protein
MISRRNSDAVALMIFKLMQLQSGIPFRHREPYHPSIDKSCTDTIGADIDFCPALGFGAIYGGLHH